MHMPIHDEWTYLLGISMSETRNVRQHLLVRALVPFGDLDYSIQNQHFPIVHRIEDEHILKLRAFMKQDFLHLPTAMRR